MKKLFTVLVMLMLFGGTVLAQAEKPLQAVGTEEDISVKVDKATDVAVEKIETFSTQLQKIIDILERKYKQIKPHVQKIVSIIAEKKRQYIENRKATQEVVEEEVVVETEP